VLIGNGLGFMTGEWKGASSESKKWLALGLTVLIVGIVIVSIGNTI
jgi:type II secretory pathway component PulL